MSPAGAYLRWPEARIRAGWQGITRLELAPDRRSVALVLAAAPASAVAVSVAGGRRPLRFELTAATTSRPVLQLAEPGDRATYVVTLQDGGGVPIDPFFASAELTFTVDCERDDCRAAPAEAPRPPAPRTVDLLTKDYDGFVRLLSDHVRVRNPHWADLSPASFERVLLELLAHHGDLLSYHQDRVAAEAFLDDATQRHSLRQHGLLLGYPLFDGEAAETTLVLTGVTAPVGRVPAGTTVEQAGSSDEAPVAFYVVDDTEVRAVHDALALAAWPGVKDAELAAGATRALLWGHDLHLAPGKVLAFLDGDFAQLVTVTEARQLQLPGWVAAPGDAPPASPGDRASPADVTEVTWTPGLQRVMRPWRPLAGDRDAGVFIRGNLARARHGARRDERIPLSADELERDRRNAVVVREQRRLDRARVRLLSSGTEFPADALAGASLAVGVSHDAGATFDVRTHRFGAGPFASVDAVLADLRADVAFLGGPNPDLAVYAQGDELAVQSVLGGTAVVLTVDPSSTALGPGALGFTPGARAEPQLGDDVILLHAVRTRGGPVTFRAVPGGGTEPVLHVATGDASGQAGEEGWTRVPHLHGSRSFDRHYVAEADEDGSVWLHFGDGRHGAALELEPGPAPAATRALFLSARDGDPIAGNCAPRTLTRFQGRSVPPALAALGASLAVTNVLPGRGGRQPESLEAARLAIPGSLRHGPLQRAVSLEDYGRAAREVPGVARAAARAMGGPFHAVLVLVDPEGTAELSDEVREAVSARIELLRMTGREHVVRQPAYVPLDVKLAVCVEPGALPHRVRAAVYAALRPGTDARPGFFHPDRLSFGQSVERGDVLAAVQAVPGVRTVKALVFRRLRDADPAKARARIVLGATEVARLDGDPLRPGDGRLEVAVVGVDAGVSEASFDAASPPAPAGGA